MTCRGQGTVHLVPTLHIEALFICTGTVDQAEQCNYQPSLAYTPPNRFLQGESSQATTFLDFKLDVLYMLFDRLKERNEMVKSILHYDNHTKPCAN